MKVLVLGCGNIGSAAAEDLAKSLSSLEIVVADKDENRAKKVVKKIDRTNVSWAQIDAANQNKLASSLKGFDVVAGFLPAMLGYRLAEACINAKTNLVDVSFMEENPLTLNNKAKKAGVTIIPDCGFAPGISNILVGNAVRKLDRAESVHIMVGGLPEKPVPPLGYTITWSPESLIDEYTRKARIVRNGKIEEGEALSGLEQIEFPNVGKLEAFYTDGLRNLLDTIKGVEEMWEKTLRYPGHAEKISMLRALGFFEEEQVEIEGIRLSPRKLTAKLFQQKLCKPEIGDIVALKVEVSGVKGSKPVRRIYHLVDHYDSVHNVTAMARTTAYPASIIAQLMLKGAIKEKGVVPPELLGMNESVFQEFLDELVNRGIRIREEIA